MPRPIAHASGVFHLNVRVTADLAAKVKGILVTLPLGDGQFTLRPSDKVILSLRTRDPTVAKARFAAAEQALLLHWDAVRSGPATLTHKQIVALAGECYRAASERLEADPEYVPDGHLRLVRQFEADVACWNDDLEDGPGAIGEHDATLLAALAPPSGLQLLAYELGRDIDVHGVAVTHDAAVEHLFGAEADELCRSQYVQEGLHLEKERIWREDDEVGWVMHFPMTKDGVARTVPVHEHLVAGGLIDHWRSAGAEHLFMFDRPAKRGASHSPQEMRASELADWTQKHVSLNAGVSANHGWRHTFATNSEAAGMQKRISTAITGHNKKRDASDGCVTPSLAQLRVAIERYPRYRI